MKHGSAKQFAITNAFFPDQDIKKLGTEVFNRVSVPVDWCTVRQAQMYEDAHEKPDSVLYDIATGRVESRVCSREEARQELAKQQRKTGSKERGG